MGDRSNENRQPHCGKGVLELLNDVKPGKTEKELAARFDYLMALGGSDGVSFDTILLTGAHTSMPHGVPENREVQKGDFVLFDFGATYRGYHSDMTRTVAVGSATAEMQAAYDLVLRAQLAGIQALHAGVPCKEVYQATYDVLARRIRRNISATPWGTAWGWKYTRVITPRPARGCLPNRQCDLYGAWHLLAGQIRHPH